MRERGDQRSFFAELKRRNVLRVAGAYLVACWALLQGADVLFGLLSLPDWTIRLVVGLLILGFPMAMFLAWAFELTPDGLKREHEVERDDSITPQTGRKLEFFIIGVLSIAVALFAFDKFFLQPRAKSLEDKSIAVLPFANMSGDATQDYFSDGLSEELINLLAKIPELRVIGRTSSFQFRGESEDLRVIAEKLGVAHILEGSVRRAGERLQISAQLVAARDGSLLWTETFDRELNDIFEVQDEIGHSVVETLKVELLGGVAADPKGRENVTAYDIYLQGLRYRRLAGETALASAESHFLKATELDPQMAAAWDGLSVVYTNQIMDAVLSPEQGIPRMKEARRLALALDPLLADAHYGRGFANMVFDHDWETSEAAYNRALEIEPNHGGALRGLGQLYAALGRMTEAVDSVARGISLDPLDVTGMHVRGFVAYLSGDYGSAEASFRSALEFLGGSYTRGNNRLSLVLLAQGRLNEALAESRKDPGEQWRLSAQAIVYHAMGRQSDSDAALAALTDRYADRAALEIAKSHAYRGEIDLAFQWLDRAHRQRDSNLAWVMTDPLLANLEHDPRFDAFLLRLNLKRDTQPESSRVSGT